jgi:hypothetical protein
MPIGSIINFGLYQIPPQPKKIKQWVITQGKKKQRILKNSKETYLKFYFHILIVDHTDYLVPFVYPVAEPNLAQASWQEYWSKKQEQEHGSLSHDQVNLFRIQFKFFLF